MSVQIQFGSSGDMKRIIALADRCFGFDQNPQDSFVRNGAKFYGEGLETSKHHLLVTIDGALVGLVGICPVTMKVGEQTLSFAGIGTVCTAPEARGKGVMQLMLNRCNEVIAEKGYDGAFLAGIYERYRHFGYEIGESICRVKMKRETTDTMLFLQPLQANDPLLANCLALHDTQSVRFERNLTTLYGLLTQWNRKPYAILNGEGDLVGYLGYTLEGNAIQELYLSDNQDLTAVAQLLMQEVDKQDLLLELPTYLKTLCTQAKAVGQVVDFEPALMVKICSFETMLSALLPLKEDLPDGQFILHVNKRERVLIRVVGGVVTVQATRQTPDIRLDWDEATKLVFGRLVPTDLSEEQQSFVKALFPLDFGIPYGDQF